MFVTEKESLVASETERYMIETQRLRELTNQLQAELDGTKTELEEATEGLAAAARLSEQMDRKEEALAMLREEGMSMICL